ncbi:hypothetical protein OLZ33_04550 [Pantoea ananatis]|uniref:hypothetical protein n=1 Tax=Pantoea ananas TaxID=553 RepID=UPI00158D7DDE|nr:hypothetical protein [Pantoea ananatis]MBA4819684.1 hypothetical protein [Pantoea ananatis]MCW1831276.1 hypothetical protein [Pantoea ananatis]QKV86535.1 hypothetical protein FOB88_05035 [Pantoea ananatis]
MRHAKLKINILIGLLCLVASFFIVLFPLGGLVDYLSQISNDFLNKNGLGFADGESDPSFLWVVGILMLIVTFIMMKVINKVWNRRQPD